MDYDRFTLSHGSDGTVLKHKLGDLASTSPRIVDTFASLSALDASTFQTGSLFKVRGRTAIEDGGGGLFRFDSTSTVTADGGMVVAPNSGGGRYLREWDKEIDPKWFGADDTGVVDASAALQAAIDFASQPTYGWQSNVGNTWTSGYTGAFFVKAIGSFDLYSPVTISDGVILEGKPGASWGNFTGHTVFNIRHGGSGFIISLFDLSRGYRIGGIKHVILNGYPQTYQGNKKTITSVTSRTVFTVADADAPPTLDDTLRRPGNNTCFFYDANNEYLGSARIISTSSAAGQTTVNLDPDTDAYSSINGTAGGKLTTTCKVVWPVRVTDEFTAVSPAFNDPALAGTVGINVKNLRTGATIGAGNPVLEDIQCWRFHTGFRFGPGVSGSLSPLNSLRSTRHKFAGFAFARPDNTADLIFSGGTFAQGIYSLDNGQTLSSSGSLTVTAATPAVFTKNAHGYIAGSGIRFGATTVPTGLSAGVMYYVSASGLTANTFQVSDTVGGTDIGLTSTGSGLYVAGNVIDYPGLNTGTYGLYGVPDLGRFDTVVAEFSALANVYSHRTLGGHIKYLFSDNSVRHGLMLGSGYSPFVSPTTSINTNWLCIDHLVLKPTPTGGVVDTFHSNRVGVFFEKTDSTLFSALAVNQISTVNNGNKFTYAFDLQLAAYNNRAKVTAIVETNGHTTWSNPASAFPEVAPPQLTSASDVNTGWYVPSANQRDFAVSGTRLLSLTSGNAQIEKSGGSQLFTLKNTSSGSTLTTTIGTETFIIEDLGGARRYGSWFSTSTDVGITIGSSVNTGAARGSQVNGELMSGTDKTSGHFFFFGPRGTGTGTSGGFQFYTGDTTTTGTTQHALTRKVYFPNAGGIRVEPQSSAPSAIGPGHFYFNTTARNFFFWDGSFYQPFSVQGDEVSVASASTVSLGAQASDKVYITGTTSITSFGAALGGTRRSVRFEGALTLTFNATSMILPGGVSIQTEAGDTLDAVCISTGNWRVTAYNRASGSVLFALNPIATTTVDASATFTFLPASSSPTQVLSAAITANRTVTLSTTSAKNGQTARFTRTAASTGAFNWDVGGLKNLSTSQWCEVAYNGSAWVLIQFGSL